MDGGGLKIERSNDSEKELVRKKKILRVISGRKINGDVQKNGKRERGISGREKVIIAAVTGRRIIPEIIPENEYLIKKSNDGGIEQTAALRLAESASFKYEFFFPVSLKNTFLPEIIPAVIKKVRLKPGSRKQHGFVIRSIRPENERILSRSDLR